MTTTRYRVEGHAGLWQHLGAALVVTDDDSFEHDGFVLMSQVADPDNVIVVEPELVSEFAVTDAPPVGAVA